MKDTSRRYRNDASNEGIIDLSEVSATNSQVRATDIPIIAFLQELEQEWLRYEADYVTSGDRDGVEFSTKIQLLCQALQKLVNPGTLTPPQQTVVRAVIICEAGAGDFVHLHNRGNAYRRILVLATFLNSSWCK